MDRFRWHGPLSGNLWRGYLLHLWVSRIAFIHHKIPTPGADERRSADTFSADTLKRMIARPQTRKQEERIRKITQGSRYLLPWV